MTDSVCSVFRTWGILIFTQCICWMRMHFTNLFVTWVGFLFLLFLGRGVSWAILTLTCSPTRKDVLSVSASPIN